MLPSKKLLPIVTYLEDYPFLTTPVKEYPTETKFTTLTAAGRMPSTCPFTQFLGPDFDSHKIITLSPGNEAIFAKLPDYTYFVSWQLKGSYLKFWTINVDKNIAYQLYDVNGKYVQSQKQTGKREIYGFNFPLVVELAFDAELQLGFSLGKHLQDDNPLLPAKKCLLTDGNKEFVYENTTDSPQRITRRVVRPSLQERKERIRNEYFQVFRGPCRTSISTLQQSERQILDIFSAPAIAAYTAQIVTQQIIQCYIPLWCGLVSEDGNLVQLTQATNPITGLPDSGSYCYVNRSGTYSFDFVRVIITYDLELPRVPMCGNWAVGLAIYNNKSLLGSIQGELINNSGRKDVIYEDTITVALDEREYIWFGGYGFITQTVIGNAIPVSITGHIVVTLL